MQVRPLKPNRSRIDLDDEAATRSWARQLGVSTAALIAAVGKVGGNAETVRKELIAAQRRESKRAPAR